MLSDQMPRGHTPSEGNSDSRVCQLCLFSLQQIDTRVHSQNVSEAAEATTEAVATKGLWWCQARRARGNGMLTSDDRLFPRHGLRQWRSRCRARMHVFRSESNVSTSLAGCA